MGLVSYIDVGMLNFCVRLIVSEIKVFAQRKQNNTALHWSQTTQRQLIISLKTWFVYSLYLRVWVFSLVPSPRTTTAVIGIPSVVISFWTIYFSKTLSIEQKSNFPLLQHFNFNFIFCLTYLRSIHELENWKYILIIKMKLMMPDHLKIIISYSDMLTKILIY